MTWSASDGEFLIDMNGTRAAIRAGYSRHRADAAASRLLKDERISAEIARRMAERNEKVGVDAQWVLRRLVEIIKRDPDGSRGDVAMRDLLRAIELVGKHTDVGAFQDKLEVNAGEDMAQLILAARRRVQKAAALRADQTPDDDDDEDDGEIVH